MLRLYLYPRSCPVAERFTFTNSRRTRRFPEGPFFLMAFILDFSGMISASTSFLKKGEDKWGGKQTEEVDAVPCCPCSPAPFPAAHAALRYFLPCHPSWLHLWPGLGHRHSTVLHKVTGKRLSPHPWSFFTVSSVAKQIKSG